jgi:hypothetical protein
MTRFGIHGLVKRYVFKAADKVPYSSQKTRERPLHTAYLCRSSPPGTRGYQHHSRVVGP